MPLKSDFSAILGGAHPAVKFSLKSHHPNRNQSETSAGM